MPAVPAGRLSRRDLLARGLVAAGAGSLAVAAGAGSLAVAGIAPAQAEDQPLDDGSLLEQVLKIEQLAAVGYRHVLASGLLSRQARMIVAPLSEHEQEHVRALERELATLGRAVPAAPTPAEAQARLSDNDVSPRLSELRSQQDALTVLVGIESLSQSAYYQALHHLRGPALIERAVQALASEAQHETLLNRLLQPYDVVQSVPDPFVQGKK